MANEIREDKLNLQKFVKLTNKMPDQHEIMVNQHAGGTQYLPISYLEMGLDEIFFGLWETVNFKWERMGNEIVGSLDLRVFHPVANIWITRTGASATMIRLKKDSKSYELENKITNALEMDFPHLKADCLRNAVQSLGKLFGRDLNRKFTDIYKPLIHQHEIEAGRETSATIQQSEMQDISDRCNERMESCRMDDPTEIGFKARIARAETQSELWQIFAELENFVYTTGDPRAQLKNMKL
jgi:hypothetical protein